MIQNMLKDTILFHTNEVLQANSYLMRELDEEDMGGGDSCRAKNNLSNLEELNTRIREPYRAP